MLITLHIVAIGAVIGITANFAYSMGKKDGLLSHEKSMRIRNKIIKQQKSNPNKVPVDVL